MNSQTHKVYEISLSISQEQMLRYYRGSAGVVVTRSRCGTVLQLAAKHLRPFIELRGVHGIFRLTLSEDKRLISIVRVK